MEAQGRSKPPKIDLTQIETEDWRTLSTTLLAAMERFYENPENVEQFNSWKKKKYEKETEAP